MSEASFTKAIKQVVKNIPQGTTMSYQAVAKTAGYPKAHRAVATVLAKNFDPTVPCHRVIKSDGNLGDYNRGGTTAKRNLLKKEGAIIK